MPDKELVCDIFHSTNCDEQPQYKTDKKMEDYGITTPDDKAFFRTKVIGKIYGVKWPCCESFAGDFGNSWRVAKEGNAPGSWKCWVAKNQKGLGV